jgi:DNA helicase II / ATP-dependent DNA helicase PcrA
VTTTPTEPVFAPLAREDGSLTWAPINLDPAAFQKAGWSVHSFRDLRKGFIAPAQARGTARTSLDNPAKPLLDLLTASSPVAVIGVSLRTAADLRDLHGYIVEPAYRRGLTLLVASDRELDELDAKDFVDPVGYAWTLERLRHVAVRFRIGPGPDGMPPLTPIEALLYRAMRDRGLAPVAQYGIGKYRADFAFTDVRLVVECDGRPWHDPDRDRRRDAALRRSGWEPIHFTGSEITRDAATCAAAVAREVARRRTIVESEQPDILIPVRRSWWARLLAWLRGRSGQGNAAPARPVVTDAAPSPDVAPVAAWAADLDPEQRAAVTSHDGVVQVIAPAGSGKTTVLVARVRELVARGVPPNRILCCTFNAAAATELQARLDQVGVEGVEAGTFHAIGRHILKRAEFLRGDVLTLSYGQWRRLAKLAMDATPDGVWIEAPAAKDQISDLKLGRMLTVDEFAQIATSPAERTLATLYRLYEEHLVEQERTDFDDFIFQAVRLLQRDAGVRRYWQGQFTAVLVDEYQDIEPAQELLIQMLAAPEDLLLCVGDEDQCLYAWRRASVERVIELDQLYPGLERHALARNYRCPVTIVDASRSLIGHNRRRFPKQILAVQTTPGNITLVTAADLEAQGAHAARLVKDAAQGQAVILARTSRVLSDIALGLAQAGIRFFGPERIKMRSGEPAVLLSYLRVLGAPSLARPDDVSAVFRVPNRYLPDDAEDNVASALRSGHSFTSAIDRLRVREEWRGERLREAALLFDELSEVTDAADMVHRLRTDGGLDRHYADAEQLNPTDNSAVDSLAHAEEAAAGMSVVEYASALDYQASIIEQHFNRNGIELATIHGAKGRQWPLVILAGVEEGELPHARSLADADDPVGELEGERRLAYVAFTRARDELQLLHASGRPSRFLAEAALAVATEPTVPQAVTSQAVTSPAPPAPVVPPGLHIVKPPTPSVHRAAPPSLAASRVVAPPPAVPRTVSLSVPSEEEIRDRVVALSKGRPRSPSSTPSPGRPPQRSRSPLALVPATKRSADGSIPCSLPGCLGTVHGEFVRPVTGGYAGLCPRADTHETLVVGSPEYDQLWAELSALREEGLRERRGSQGSDTGSLADGAIRCCVPGCRGIVKREYVVEVDGVKVGFCGQRTLHTELAQVNPAVAGELRRLEDARQRAVPAVTPGGSRTELLRAGGIPCSIPGCDGVVGRGFVITCDDGEAGICGLVAQHAGLIAADPEARREFDRLQVLEVERRRAWVNTHRAT